MQWVLWEKFGFIGYFGILNLDTTEIKENSIPSGSIEGKTDFGEIGYGGPSPT